MPTRCRGVATGEIGGAAVVRGATGARRVIAVGELDDPVVASQADALPDEAEGHRAGRLPNDPPQHGVAVRVEEGRVSGLYYVRNPDKLSRVGAETPLSRGASSPGR